MGLRCKRRMAGLAMVLTACAAPADEAPAVARLSPADTAGPDAVPDKTDSAPRLEHLPLRAGEETRFSLVRGSEPVAGASWSSSDPSVVTVSASGVAYALRPGGAVVTAAAGDVVAEVTVAVTTLPLGAVTEIAQAPLAAGSVQQGILRTPSHAFGSANGSDGPASRIFRYSPDLVLEAEAVVLPPGSLGIHIGSLAWDGAFVYAACMDGESLSASTKDPNAAVLTGLARIDPLSLELVGYDDLTALYGNYFDAIDIADGYLWAGLKQILVRLRMTPEGPDLASAAYYWLAVHGAAQGVRVRDGVLYWVPENTTSSPYVSGIVAYDVASLVPFTDFGARAFNRPYGVYSFSYPTVAQPDHEAFDFDPEDAAVAYVSYFPGDSVVTLKLGLLPR